MCEGRYATDRGQRCDLLTFQTGCAIVYLCRCFSFFFFSTVSESGLRFALLSTEISHLTTEEYVSLQ